MGIYIHIIYVYIHGSVISCSITLEELRIGHYIQDMNHEDVVRWHILSHNRYILSHIILSDNRYITDISHYIYILSYNDNTQKTEISNLYLNSEKVWFTHEGLSY